MMMYIKYFLIIICVCLLLDVKASPPENTETIRILAWNVYMLPPMIKITGKIKRAKAIGDKLQFEDYDVIVLEETFHKLARNIIVKKLKDKYPYIFLPPKSNVISFKTNSGVTIFSKHESKLVGHIQYKEKVGFDNKMARKGATMIEVRKNNTIFSVIGTHLNSNGSLNIRLSQVKQIKEELINKYRDSLSIPIFICGDFNIDKLENDGGFDSVKTILESDTPDDIESKYNDFFTNNGFVKDQNPSYLGSIIDYIFYNNIAQFGNVKTKIIIPKIEHEWKKRESGLSDHKPIELLISIEGN